MAKKSKKAKKVVRRRRVSGVPGGEGLQLLIGSALGAVGSRFATKMIQSKMNLDAKILNGAFLAAGGLLAMKAKNPLFRGAGIGLGSAAAIGLGQSVGLLSGVGMGNTTLYVYKPLPRVGSFQNVPKVGQAAPLLFPTPAATNGKANLYAGVYGN